jgi:hypothetical protein
MQPCRLAHAQDLAPQLDLEAAEPPVGLRVVDT